MNLVLRVSTDKRSVILKQSRPWVEKYPSIQAPVERMQVETAFYRLLADLPELSRQMPRLIETDPENFAALFEDLGNVEDYTFLYNRRIVSHEMFRPLVKWLSILHNTTFPATVRRELENRGMRELNHAHLYDIPLRRSNGLDLDGITEGLQAEADRLKQNAPFVRQITALGELYLSNGPTLLHGDFYPGSWVQTKNGPGIIDPEFGFFGPAEYDLGVMRAHLLMAGFDSASVDTVLADYEPGHAYDSALESRFAGMEIMRRLIGVAQLPMERTLEQKRALLQLSEQLVLGPD